MQKDKLIQSAGTLVAEYAPDGVAKPVDYGDCYNFEPINFLYGEQTDSGEWREETWAMELFFKAPDGQRAGPLLHAVENDSELTRLLDQVALLTLRDIVIGQLLDRYPSLVFSMNVTLETLMDWPWFPNFVDELGKQLGQRGARQRVVYEIQEHPHELLKHKGIDEDALHRTMELFRHARAPFAIDDAFVPGYVFQATRDALDGAIVWQKMDWQYFQKKARDARETLVSGIREGQRSPVRLIIEGVENETLKTFLVEKTPLAPEGFCRLSIQGFGLTVRPRASFVEDLLVDVRQETVPDLVHACKGRGMRKEVVAALAKALTEKVDPTERYWIYIALGRIGGKDAEAVVKGRLTEENGFTRQGVEEALREMNSNRNTRATREKQRDAG